MEENSVCFMCARCKQLVKLDSSFDSINDKDFQDFTSSSIASANTHEDSQPNHLTLTKENLITNVCYFYIVKYNNL